MRIEDISFIKQKCNGFTYLRAPNINTKHAFSTRCGEPSDGRFSDESMNVLCNALGISPQKVIYNKQVRGADVFTVTQSVLRSHFSILNYQNEADALITKVTGVALMVFTADCVPILLHDPVQGAIGAVHAGWQGTALNIAAVTVRKMKSELGCSPADIRAAIGPCISKCCFETDADVADIIRDALCSAADTQAANNCISPRSKKYMIDLKEANRIMLINAGVRDISVSGDCTFCTDGLYWSHRKHGRERGSQAAVIQIQN